MRVVLDTNVVASALHGAVRPTADRFAGKGSLECFTSEALLSEFAGILGRAKFAQKLRQKSISASEIVARHRPAAAANHDLWAAEKTAKRLLKKIKPINVDRFTAAA